MCLLLKFADRFQLTVAVCQLESLERMSVAVIACMSERLWWDLIWFGMLIECFADFWLCVFTHMCLGGFVVELLNWQTVVLVSVCVWMCVYVCVCVKWSGKSKLFEGVFNMFQLKWKQTIVTNVQGFFANTSMWKQVRCLLDCWKSKPFACLRFSYLLV